MSCGEFLALIQAKRHQFERKAGMHLDVLRMLRLIFTVVHNANNPKNQKSPRDLIPFESDREEPKDSGLDPSVLKKEIEQGVWQKVKLER